MKTIIDFDDNTWNTILDDDTEFDGTFTFRSNIGQVQIDWCSNLPSNWEDIENDIYLEVISNY